MSDINLNYKKEDLKFYNSLTNAFEFIFKYLQ